MAHSPSPPKTARAYSARVYHAEKFRPTHHSSARPYTRSTMIAESDTGVEQQENTLAKALECSRRAIQSKWSQFGQRLHAAKGSIVEGPQSSQLLPRISNRVEQSLHCGSSNKPAAKVYTKDFWRPPSRSYPKTVRRTRSRPKQLLEQHIPSAPFHPAKDKLSKLKWERVRNFAAFDANAMEAYASLRPHEFVWVQSQ